MNVNTFAEWLRIVNVITGIVVFTWLIIRCSCHWSEYPAMMRIFMTVIAAYVLASIYASAEAIYSHLTFGLRTFLTEAADFLLAWGLWRTRDNTYQYRRLRKSERREP